MNMIQYVFGLFVVCFSVGCVSVDNPTPSDPDDVVTEALKEGEALLLEKKFVRKNYSNTGGFFRGFFISETIDAGSFGEHSKITDGVNSTNDIDTFIIRYGSEKTLHFLTDLLVFINTGPRPGFYGITFTIRVSESGDVSVKPIINSRYITNTDLNYLNINGIPDYDHDRDFANLKRSDINDNAGENSDLIRERILLSFDIGNVQVQIK